ncbi:hypothetical protein LJC23_05245 [Desulfovibrio sp. OttesenSCG-928-I05]|nr:hypothetical protein [Desulfovibrio sp. OttesenSCG-928-I05]
MTTIHSTMNLFGAASAPFSSLSPQAARGYGRGRALMAERGWKGVNLLPATEEGFRFAKDVRVKALLDAAENIEYLITDTTPITREFLEKAKKLKLVSMFGVGTDHIDVPAATDHGIIVTRALNTNSRSVAEFALALLFALARHIPQMHEAMHGGIWQGLRGTEIAGKTLGIVGLGAIGTQLAKLGKAVGMDVIATVRTPKPERARELGCVILPLDEMLRRADYVCLCLPGGGGVLLGEREFELMKPSAGLINVARGNVVDEPALIAALTQGQIGGAALDVYTVEPLPGDSPLLKLPNVIVAPHVGSNTFEATDAVFLLCLEEVRRRAAGEESAAAFNPHAYAVKRI